MIKKLLIILFPLVSVLVFWSLVYRAPLVLMDDIKLETTSFSDKKDEGGQSELIATIDSAAWKAVRFNLQEGFISPYAGISFFRKDHYWNIKGYDHIKLELEVENIRNLELSIATYQGNVTKENEPFTFRHNIIEIPLSDNSNQYIISLDRMTIAQWWLERFKLRSTELDHADWSKVSSLSFTAKIKIYPDRNQFLKVRSIVIAKDISWFYPVALCFLIFWFSGLLFYQKLQRRKNPSQAVVQYLPIESKLIEIDDSVSIALEFVAHQYSNSELTLQYISSTLKIPEKAISAEIKKKYKLSFKEHLNNIRISEAKRLLCLEDFNVSEIAYQVGFSNPSHFNRVFKSLEECTPTEFRNKLLNEK